MIEFAKESLRIFFYGCFGFFLFNCFLALIGLIYSLIKYIFVKEKK